MIQVNGTSGLMTQIHDAPLRLDETGHAADRCPVWLAWLYVA